MKNKSWNGFRKPIKKGDIKTKKTGNMTLVLEGSTKAEKAVFLKVYSMLNRQGKRDFIRAQAIARRAVRKDNDDDTKYSFRLNAKEKEYNEKLRVSLRAKGNCCCSYLGAIHHLNEILRAEAEKRRNAVED